MKESCVASKRLSLDIQDTARVRSLPTSLKGHLHRTVSVLERFLWQGRGVQTWYPSQARLKDRINLKDWGVQKGNLQLLLCGKKKIQQLNKSYRRKNKPTDVLSFPVHDSLRGKPGRGEGGEHQMLLGDVVICREVAAAQAKEFRISYEAEVVHLLVHGVLHLVGYDHEISSREEDLMFALEDKIMSKV